MLLIFKNSGINIKNCERKYKNTIVKLKSKVQI